MTEAQKKRKLKQIEKLKKVLREERIFFGGYYDDSAGRRYSIADIYFEIGDYSKTNRYLNWFYKNFPDDATYAYFQLGAAVTYFEKKKIDNAIESIIELNSSNLYFIDLLLGKPVVDHNKYEWSDSETLQSARKYIVELRKLVTPNFISWLTKIESEKNYQLWFKKFLSILKLLDGLDEYEERSKLLNAKNKSLKNWASALKSNLTKK